MLRRSLLAWGLGHLALGDRRGFLLLALELLWLAALGVSLALLATDRWLLAYALLAGFIVAWVAQAVAAYRRARMRSGRSTGAAWLLMIAPVVITVLSGFWLFAGAQATPASTFERYVGAWRHEDPGAASALFVTIPDVASLSARWRAQDELIARQVTDLTRADPSLGLNDDDPEANLRFEVHVDGAGAAPADTASFDVQVVRQVIVPTTFFGLLPASRTENEVVASVGRATLVRQFLGGPLAATGASLWRIQSIRFVGEP